MTIHIVPKDTVGHYVFPDGCTDAVVIACNALTSISFPDDCTTALVSNCNALTSISFPDDCTAAAVSNCNALTSISFPDDCTAAAVSNCNAYKSLHNDFRGYQMVYAGGFYHAGCRTFTAKQALDHWGHGYEGDGDGPAYCAAIRKHQAEIRSLLT